MTPKNKGFAQILATGQYASIQDKGRTGYEMYGVPASGYLVGSWVADTAVNAIEFFGVGLHIRFSKPLVLCFAGTGIDLKRNDELIQDVTVVSVREGDNIKIIQNEGRIGYLLVEMGWECEYIMNSYAQMKGITLFDRLYPGMVLGYVPHSIDVTILKNSKPHPKCKNLKITVQPGPEWLKHHHQTHEIHLTIHAATNRQAVSFNENIQGHFPEIQSSYTPVGTVQVTTSGKVFILGKDGQTTGGYFRWGFVNQGDLEKLYCSMPGSIVTLTMPKMY